MPTYTYRRTDPQSAKCCDICLESFEQLQKMSDEPLTACPKCGAAVERVMPEVNISGHNRYNKNRSPKDLERLGFTQYKRKGKGYYEKQFGTQGPQTIQGQ